MGIGLLVVIPFLTMKAQKALTPQDLQAWKRITTRVISDDGQWVYQIHLFIYDNAIPQKYKSISKENQVI